MVRNEHKTWTRKNKQNRGIDRTYNRAKGRRSLLKKIGKTKRIMGDNDLPPSPTKAKKELDPDQVELPRLLHQVFD
jgi:hypothetical protein